MEQMTIDGTFEKVAVTERPLNPTYTKRKRGTTKAKGYGGIPGTGPEGETCKTCCHKYANEMRSGRVFWKCQLMKHAWTGGRGSDILMKSPACGRWEE